jgi:hypothetical protein
VCSAEPETERIRSIHVVLEARNRRGFGFLTIETLVVNAYDKGAVGWFEGTLAQNLSRNP